MTVFQDHLYMAWKGAFNDQGIYWSRFDGVHWIAQSRVGDVGTSVGVTLAPIFDRLYMVWKGIDDDPGIYWASFDGNNWL